MNAARSEVMPADAGTTIAEYSPTVQALADLRTKYEGVVFDVSTGKAMAVAKEARAELREHRVTLERERVRIKAPALERCRQIDSEAKRITAELVALEGPIDSQIKAEEQRKQLEKEAREQAERDRVIAVNARFEALKALPMRAVNATAAEIESVIAEAGEIDPESFPDDLQAAAVYERRIVIAALRAALDRQRAADEDVERAEVERAELVKLRAEQATMQAERDRLAQAEADRLAASARADRDEAIRVEAAAQAERDAAAAIEQAKRDAIDAEARREREAVEAQQAAHDAAQRAADAQAEAVRQAEARVANWIADAERARQDAEAAQRAEDERRAANRRHVGAVNRKAAEALVAGGLSEADAKTAVTVIATGKVPAVSIAY